MPKMTYLVDVSEPPIAYSVSEASKIIGVSEDEIINIANKGKLHGMTIGNSFVIESKSLVAFAQSIMRRLVNSLDCGDLVKWLEDPEMRLMSILDQITQPPLDKAYIITSGEMEL